MGFMKPLSRRTGWCLVLALGPSLFAACQPSEGAGDGWSPTPGLTTRWTAEVDPSNPLPEYPRPQLVREGWVNLNGLWSLAILPDGGSQPLEYPDQILVPFPVESSLSGLGRTVSPSDRVWYRRTFTLPDAEGPGGTPRWLLHFGAVDWEAEVFLDGTRLGGHQGGYDPFSFDITSALGEGGEHELIVAVRDPTDQGNQPRGKQVLEPRGIWYTAVTGIWQTVWLEQVPGVYVEELTIVPDLGRGGVEVRVGVMGGEAPASVRVSVTDQGREVAATEGSSEDAHFLPIPGAHLWSPDDPFLYDLLVELELGEGGGSDDRVRSYFGMRSIAVGDDAQGRPRLLLNGEPLFQYGLLDQGWWPDGLYTAPTDEALRFDITTSKSLGFNLIRKHVKVEPARWYYHADREGVLVWQDMPSGDNEGDGGRRQFANELRSFLAYLRNHPSIVMWVPFNEGWGQHDTEPVTGFVKALDPTRLVNAASGWTDEGGGDVLDIHAYPGPGSPAPSALIRWAPPPRRYPAGLPSFPETRVPVLGEFGGLGLPLPGHTWLEEENWGYRSYPDLDTLNEAYRELLFQLMPLIGEGLAAAVYTQTTDVEIEVNGVMSYDREVVKLDAASVAANHALFGNLPTLREVVPTSREVPQLWRIREEAPPDGWFAQDFDDSGWLQAAGGFGTAGTPGAQVGTEWEGSDLWLRREFELEGGDLSALQNGTLLLRIHHDEDAEVYLNGVRIAALEGYTTGYRLESLDEEAIGLLLEGGNSLAVHVAQTGGGQFIDVGIVELIEGHENQE
jgi:hypothetical protein